MTDASPVLEQQVRESFARFEPGRMFEGCKVAEDEMGMVVRIYSQSPQGPRVFPPPYQIFRFDRGNGILSLLTGDDAAPYMIAMYK